MRLFIALDLPGETRARLSQYMERIRIYAQGVRWPRVEGLHVTLKFIGEVKDAKAEEIKNALANVHAPPFEVTFANVGFFPNPKSPRVFWAGVEGGQALRELAGAVDEALERIGIEREQKAYHPHLTLARAATKDPHSLKGLVPLLNAEAAPEFGTMTAREFWLYRSQPGPGGSKYTKLQKYALG
jgi:RNA 2',3'-cyclic 3'-phosphodiesterase